MKKNVEKKGFRLDKNSRKLYNQYIRWYGENMGINKSKNIKLLILGILGAISLVTGISFAVFSAFIEGNEVQSINTGCLKVEMSDNGSLNLTNAYPVSDSEGLTSDPYI